MIIRNQKESSGGFQMLVEERHRIILEKLFQNNPFPVLTKKEFVDIVCDQLELLEKNIVIHRLTGDPKKEDLIAPSWVLKKFTVLNDIDAELNRRHSYQGKLSR